MAAGHEGWMHPVVAFALPFRMPDFFLISGLFLANVIDRDWRTYLDRKVVHFVYFYLLWMTIQFAVKAPGLAARARRRRSRAALSRLAHRSVRHAVVHLPAADLLRLHQADAPRAGAGRLAVRRRARDRAHQDRLDGAGRIRRPLRLLLHRLHLGEARSSRSPRARSCIRCSASPACSPGAWSTARWCISATRRCRSFRSRSASPAPARWYASRR